MKKDLLRDFISERVSVVTGLKTAIMTDGGEVAEIPLICDGVLVDYDDVFLMLEDVDKQLPSLVRIDQVVKLELADAVEAAAIMDMPGRPKKDDMC